MTSASSESKGALILSIIGGVGAGGAWGWPYGLMGFVALLLLTAVLARGRVRSS